MKSSVLATTQMLTAVLTLGYSAPASATNWDFCGAGPPDITGGAWTPEAKANTEPVWNGPSTNCSHVFSVYTDTRMDYHCYIFNSAGNTWTYMNFPDLGFFGWVWDGNLKDNGSPIHCP
jgi:hypothetical protein